MITPADLIALPADPDLPLAGVALALRGLAGAADFHAASRYTALREAAAEVILALATRRALGSQGLAYRLFGSGASSLILGGHACVVSSRLVWKPSEFERVAAGLENLLALELPLPAALPVSPGGADALALFALMTARVAPDADEAARLARSGRPVWMAHILPPEWARPGKTGLGAVSLRSEMDAPSSLTLHGMDAGGAALEETLSLPPGQAAAGRRPFAGLAAISARQPVCAPLTLAAGGRTVTVRPAQWANLWMPPDGLWLLGYLAGDDLRRLTAPHNRLQPRVPVAALRPLPPLFARLRRWQAQRSP